jgi:hypothetical protein
MTAAAPPSLAAATTNMKLAGFGEAMLSQLRGGCRWSSSSAPVTVACSVSGIRPAPGGGAWRMFAHWCN